MGVTTATAPQQSPDRSKSPSVNYLIAVPAAVVLGPICLAGAALAIAAILANIVSGFDPANWFAGGLFDQLGGGGAGAGMRWVVFMVGAVVSSGCWTAIRAAFRRR